MYLPVSQKGGAGAPSVWPSLTSQEDWQRSKKAGQGFPSKAITNRHKQPGQVHKFNEQQVSISA